MRCLGNFLWRPVFGQGKLLPKMVSEEKRLNVAVTYFHYKYVIELKIWRCEAAHQKGMNQLADFLDRQHLSEGYLLIFDRSKTKIWEKKLFEAWG